MWQIESFNYIADKNSQVLLLGTMPGIASLKAKQYYGHPDNLFWDIMFRVLDKSWNPEEVVETSYEAKKNLLLKNHIALWDVLQYCERKGNLDSCIINEIKNDFSYFFSEYPEIKVIFFNGKKAHEYFTEIQNTIKGIDKIQQYILPSTSPSNTINSFRILKQWTIIRNFISI